MAATNHNSGLLKRFLPAIAILVVATPVAHALSTGISPVNERQAAEIIGKMKNAYGQIDGYETDVEESEYRHGYLNEEMRFRYIFKKPDHVRIDMEAPHPGTVLVYPDKTGKVTVRPGGWAGFFTMHLSPGSIFLRNDSGQRIDQTDMGLLIDNISHSLTDRRHGEVGLSERDGRVVIEVLAMDHFHAGMLTLYQFYIDKKTWMPVEIEEFTPDNIIRRKVIFRNLRLLMDVPDSLFLTDGGK